MPPKPTRLKCFIGNVEKPLFKGEAVIAESEVRKEDKYDQNDSGKNKNVKFMAKRHKKMN